MREDAIEDVFHVKRLIHFKEKRNSKDELKIKEESVDDLPVSNFIMIKIL